MVAETSYEMLEVLAFCNRERSQPPSITITVLTFRVKKKYNEEFRGVYLLTIREKNFKSNLVLVVESKGLYYFRRRVKRFLREKVWPE